jgi:hypothetical protein
MMYNNMFASSFLCMYVVFHQETCDSCRTVRKWEGGRKIVIEGKQGMLY